MTHSFPTRRSSDLVLSASWPNENWERRGLLDLQKPTWSTATTRKPAPASAAIADSQVAAQKFLPCNSSTVRPLGSAVAATSMYAIDSFCCCESNSKRLTGCG